MNPAITPHARHAEPPSTRQAGHHESVARFIGPPVWELPGLIILLIFGQAVYLTFESLETVANVVLPLGLGLILAGGCWVIAKRNIVALLTPVMLLRIAIISYGSAGSLVTALGDDATLNVILTFFSFSQQELLKYNLTILAFTIAFDAIQQALHALQDRVGSATALRPENLGIVRSNLSIMVIGMSFIIIGSFVTFFVILPFQYGLYDTTFPVVVAQIAFAGYIGIFLCLVWSLLQRPSIAFVFVGMGLIFSFFGATTFAKTDIILPLMMIAMAFIYVRPTIWRMAASAVIILAIYQASQPMITYGRNAIGADYGTITAAVGLEERLDILARYFAADASETDTEVDYALVRFSYANVGTAVIADYDNGNGGSSLANAYAVFIPRILWPGKPVLTDLSRELNYAISGNDQSAVATGFAVEGYWNYGWWGVIIIGAMVGAILWLWSIYAIHVQLAGAWHLFLIVLLGIRTGSRYDGFFVVDMMGPLVFAIVGHVVLVLINRAIPALQDRRYR